MDQIIRIRFAIESGLKEIIINFKLQKAVEICKTAE